MKSVSFPFNKSGLWEKNFHDVTWRFFFTTDKTWQKLPEGPHFSRSFLSPRIISPLSLPSLHKVGGIYFGVGVVGTRLPFRARGTCCMFVPGCHTRWMPNLAQGTEYPIPVPPCSGFSSPGKPVPTFLATTVAIRSRSKLLQKPRCPGGSRTAVPVPSKENSWALSPLPDYILSQGITLKTSPRFLTLFMSWCSHGNSSYARNSSSLEWQRKHKFTRQRFFQRLTELMGLWEEIPAEAQTQGCSW